MVRHGSGCCTLSDYLLVETSKLTHTHFFYIYIYHARLGEDVAASSIQRHTLAGVAVTEAAASDHHVVKSVVIFVLRAPASSTKQGVSQREQTGEVDPDVGHGDQL